MNSKSDRLRQRVKVGGNSIRVKLSRERSLIFFPSSGEEKRIVDSLRSLEPGKKQWRAKLAQLVEIMRQRSLRASELSQQLMESSGRVQALLQKGQEGASSRADQDRLRDELLSMVQLLSSELN